MYCTWNITESIVFLGGNDRRLPFFEGFYPVPHGMSYNAYLLKGEKTVLFDTVDHAVSELFFDNLAHELGERTLDFIIVHHMEPDHSATLKATIQKYPSARVICTPKAADMITQFTGLHLGDRLRTVADGESVTLGSHEFVFYTAPMVHWPEVMVTYDKAEKALFSADAFGTFGALDGALFADQYDFDTELLPEVRRYYCNIVGKYGPQVQALLKKTASLDLHLILPLHGPVYRGDFNRILEKYDRWSSFLPEEKGVTLAFASVYGNTACAAEILARKLADRSVKVAVFDVSVTHPSEIIASAFRYSHLVFASTTYNAGIFVKMEDLLRDLAAHSLRNRTVALVQNGSWAPTAGKQMKELLSALKGFEFIGDTLDIRSALRPEQLPALDALADAIKESIDQ